MSQIVPVAYLRPELVLEGEEALAILDAPLRLDRGLGRPVLEDHLRLRQVPSERGARAEQDEGSEGDLSVDEQVGVAEEVRVAQPGEVRIA
ncbi:MAG TPA: hypothetical protein DFS52_11735 [Myxococcales bacterium]|nr:hypothetical protein [Myxococcales bacterium]